MTCAAKYNEHQTWKFATWRQMWLAMAIGLLGLTDEDVMVHVMNVKKLSVLWNEEVE
jgi:hypothetical protein